MRLSEIKEPQLILVVGCIGLVFNVAGMFLFGHHHGHGHSHDHDHSPTENIEDGLDYPINHSNTLLSPAIFQQSIIDTANKVTLAQQTEINEASHLLNNNSLTSYNHSHPSNEVGQHDHSHSGDHSHDHHHGEGALNMRGVYLHVLGDALASLAVIFTALIIWKGTFKERYLFDPLISIVITVLIIKFTMPLIKSASIILLQGVPSNVPIEKVRSEVLLISGINSIHDLHVWQLSDTKSVASVHIVVDSPHHSKFSKVAKEVKKVLHKYGVHSVTIQPEFEGDDHGTNESSPRLQGKDSACLLPCQKECAPIQCCPPVPNSDLEL